MQVQGGELPFPVDCWTAGLRPSEAFTIDRHRPFVTLRDRHYERAGRAKKAVFGNSGSATTRPANALGCITAAPTHKQCKSRAAATKRHQRGGLRHGARQPLAFLCSGAPAD